jgi:hypothetical protein
MTEELLDTMTDKDSRFVIEATYAVITALLDAEEPINKTHLYHKRARRIMKDLEAFTRQR